jgi:hypothetical protein
MGYNDPSFFFLNWRRRRQERPEGNENKKKFWGCCKHNIFAIFLLSSYDVVSIWKSNLKQNLGVNFNDLFQSNLFQSNDLIHCTEYITKYYITISSDYT